MGEGLTAILDDQLSAPATGSAGRAADRARAIMRDGQSGRTNDIVHFDFGPANCLALGDRLTAVVDWGDCRDGDASYDLVSFAWDLHAWPRDDRAVVARVDQEIAATTSAGAAALYAAHIALCNLDWACGTSWQDHITERADAFLSRWST